MRVLLAIALLALVGCGGGGTSAPATPVYQVKMMARLAHIGAVPAEPGFNASVMTPGAVTAIDDSVEQQASAPADVALTIGAAKSLDFSTLPAYLQAAASHSNVRWVYLYDELYWTGSVQLGLGADQVERAVGVIHAAGKLAAVSILPDVILAPGFELLPGLDVIVVDVYPAARPNASFANCPGNNPYSAALACSVHRLRALGYTGQIWYAYEAFGDVDVPDLASKLTQQRQTIAAAPALGVSGLVAFGFYDDTHTNLLPPLYPGHGSPIEPLVDCSKC
jgi:hypothetical protein